LYLFVEALLLRAESVSCRAVKILDLFLNAADQENAVATGSRVKFDKKCLQTSLFNRDQPSSTPLLVNDAGRLSFQAPDRLFFL